MLNGEKGRPVEVADIERAVRLSQQVTWLALGTCVAARLLVSRLRISRTTKRGRRA